LAAALAAAENVQMDGDLDMSRGVICLISADPIGAADAFGRAVTAFETEDAPRVGTALNRAALSNWMSGRLEPAAELAAAATARTSAFGKFAESGMAKGIAAGVANCLGDPSALELAHEAALTTEWSRFGQAAAFVFPALARARADRGEFTEAHAALDRLADFGSPAADLLRPLLYALDGDAPAATRAMQSLVPFTGADRLMAVGRAVHVRVAELIGEVGDVDASRQVLRAIVDAGVRFDTCWGFDLEALAAVGTAPTGRTN
jgi:hypothetical protein